MKQAVSVYSPGVIAAIEQFTCAEEELRQFVVYTYYDKGGIPLYVGCSKDFYNAHYHNSMRFSFFEEVEYVGFVFMDNEEDIKDAKRYFIEWRNPKHNKRRYKGLQELKELEDELIVSNQEMMQRWREWLGVDENDATSLEVIEVLTEETDNDISSEYAVNTTKCCATCDIREGRYCIVAGDYVKMDGRCSEWC